MRTNIIYDDFTGFTFNGKHSSQFGLVRVSDGDRYEDSLVLDHSNEAADVPGGVGQYYFGEQTKERKFKIDVAYDSVTEVEKREIRQWLHPDDKLHELIFDERPYVKYFVKCSGDVVAKELCFDEGGQRIYKGEIDIEFTAFMPYGIAAFRKLSYNKNPEDWEGASGLLSEATFSEYYIDRVIVDNGKTFIPTYNPGDVPTGFELTFEKEASGVIINRARENYQPSSSEFIFREELGNSIIFTPKAKLLTVNVEDSTAYIEDGGIKIDWGYIEKLGNRFMFVSENSGRYYNLYKNASFTSKAYYYNAFDLELRTQYFGITSTGQKVEFACVNNETISDLSNGGPLKVARIYMLPTSDSVITFKINNEIGFTLKIPSGANTNPEYWTEGQKMLYNKCKVKIDTNKQLIQYALWNETLQKYEEDNWIGISGVLTEGSLFKIPVSQTRNNIYTIEIEQDTSNPFGTISNVQINYPYLYI